MKKKGMCKLHIFVVYFFVNFSCELWVKMSEISNARKQIHTETENVIGEESESSESVDICNSAGPSQDYENSYTSLKLGLVHLLA